jgi:diguanylate cyclase (GGDEF)-like protein/PAS domain S-box-containing protein
LLGGDSAVLLRSIRSRLLALVVATVVPFIVLIGAGLWRQWQIDQTTAAQQTIGEARLLAALVDDHIGNLENLLIGLSRAVSTNPLDRAKNDALLREVRSDEPQFVGQIELLALDGSVLGSSFPADRVRRNGSDRRYFKEVLAGNPLSVGDLIRGTHSQRWIVTMARPVMDESGRLAAVLVIGTWLDRFQEVLLTRGLPPGGIVTIIDKDGIIIARTVDAARWIGRDRSKVGHTPAHLAQREGSQIVAWTSDGIERVTAFSMAHRAPWQITVGVPTKTAFAAVAARLGWSSLCILAALVIGFAIAWIFSGHVARPLRQLGRDAALLASGNLGHRSKVKTQDEIGALADDFNRMATALERRAEETRGAVDEVRQAKDTLAAVIDASPVAIVCCDLERKTVLWNRSAEDMFGYSADEVMGRPTDLRRPPGETGSQLLFQQAVTGETFRNVELRRLRKDGSLIHVRVAAAPMYNLDGTVRGVARAYLDITESKRAEEQLWRLAHYDPLTGLPNRLSLQKELVRLLAGSEHSPVAIALFDLDGFKDVNDTLGHSTGDQLLIEVCRRFNEIAGSLGTGKVCRLGGDEFVVIVPDCGDPRVIGGIVDTILRRLAEPFEINGNILHIGGSAGIAIAPSDASQADELIANADLALYQAKSDGGRVYRFFLPALRARAQARRGLAIELRRAFAEGELELFFQPQLRLSDEAVLGAEALLRWRHPERGMILPGAFIEALAESSIAREVGKWIIRTACEQTVVWRSLGLHVDRIGVNLFPAQAHSATLVADVEEALRANGLPADCLELEITENAALDGEEPGATLQKIDQLGVKLAFDDFGTGYASLTYLTRFPVWRIKIDRGFVSRITNSPDDAAMVRSLIAMAHNLGLCVIAEGVETEAQAAFLRQEGCEEAQGFLYSEPLPAAEFAAYLRARRLAAPGEGRGETALHVSPERRVAQKPALRRRLRRM